MLSDYIRDHLAQARYELIDEGTRFYGEIPACKGVWATGATLEATRDELKEVLEGWIITRLREQLSVPGLGGRRRPATGPRERQAPRARHRAHA